MSIPILMATPESHGISSRDLQGAVTFLQERQVPLHSLLVMRHGRLLCEGYCAPYGPDSLHRMFSETKSLVSLAIGTLCEEGRLRLTDPIVDYFPEYTMRQAPSDWLRALRIRDMLRMATPYNKTTYKSYPSDDWVGSFMSAPPDHPAGSFFAYDTSSTHVLCALVERLTGQSLLDYLRGVCLDEIGFSKDAWCLTDPMGITQGGSGLMATPRDMLRLMMLLTDPGQTLLPRDYLEAATSRQIDTLAWGSNGEWDFSQGYGYQFWRLTHNAWAMYGMGGQFAICVPDADMIIITTADTQAIQGGTQLILDALWTYVLPRHPDAPLPEDPEAYASLQETLAGMRLPAVPGATDNARPGIYGRPYTMLENAAGVQGVCLYEDHLEIQYTDAKLDLPYALEGQTYTSLDGDADLPCAISAGWRAEGEFLMRVQLIGARIGTVLFRLIYTDAGVVLSMRDHEEFPEARFQGNCTGR